MSPISLLVSLEANSGSIIKAWNTLVNASVKVWNALANASIKAWNGASNQ